MPKPAPPKPLLNKKPAPAKQQPGKQPVQGASTQASKQTKGPPGKKPPLMPPMKSGWDAGHDLSEVDSNFLIAELIRRGEWPE